MKSRQILFVTIISLVFIFGYLAIFPSNELTGQVTLVQNNNHNLLNNNITENNLTNNNSTENNFIKLQTNEQLNVVNQNFVVHPQEFKFRGISGTKQTAEIIIINNLDHPITLTIDSDDQAVIPITNSITVEHSITVPITVMLQNKNVILSISDGNNTVPVQFSLEALQQLPADKELPTQLQGTWNTTRIVNAMLSIILLAILVLATIQRKLLLHSDR